MRSGYFKKLGSFVRNDLPIVEISLGIMIGQIVLKYAAEEIDEEQCVTEILMSGAGTMAFQAGMIFGGPAGAVIATIVIGKISETILKYQQQKRLAREKEVRFNSIIREAMCALEKQKDILRCLRDEKSLKLQNAFTLGIEHIQIGIVENSVDNIIDGLNCFLSVFNQECVFKSIEEFNTFFDNDDSILIL